MMSDAPSIDMAAASTAQPPALNALADSNLQRIVNASSSNSPSELIASSYSCLLKSCDRALTVVNSKGSAKQAVDSLSTIEKINSSETCSGAINLGQILATNEGKKLELELIHARQAALSTLPSASVTKPSDSMDGVQFKFTFKRKNFNPDLPVVNPVSEFYKATEHEIEIADTYVTSLGEVVYIDATEDFNVIKTQVETHSLDSGTLLSDIFEINAQIVSSHSIKTGTFKRSLLEEFCLLSTCEDGRQVLKTDATVNFLKKYNRKFRSDNAIEAIELFGSKGNSAMVSLKIHVSLPVYRLFMKTPRPIIMLHAIKTRIYEQVPIIQCMKCTKFGHISDGCPNAGRCRFCASDLPPPKGHLSKDCPSKSHPTCANCLDESVNHELDTTSFPPHHASSFTCPLLRAQANKVRADAKRVAIQNFTFKY